MNAFKTILSTSLFAVLFLLCLAFVAMRLSGLGTFVVTGGSMEPAIHKGSLIIVQPVLPAQVAVGDVITFQKYDQTTSHRVIAIKETAAGPIFTTKGDANAVADPEATVFPGQVGIVRTSVPVVGYAVASLQAYWRLLLSLIAAVVFFTCAGALIFKRDQAATAPVRTRIRPARGTAPVTATVDDLDAVWNTHLSWIDRRDTRSLRAA